MNENDMPPENTPPLLVDYHPDKLQIEDWSSLKNAVNDFANDPPQHETIFKNEMTFDEPYVYKEVGQMALKSILPDLETNHPSNKLAVLASPVDTKALVERQIESEASYDITIDTAAYGDQLSAAEIVERMEVDHAVKTAPRLLEQMGDDSRTNKIVSIAHGLSLGAYTSRSEHVPKRVARTEKEVIEETVRYLETAIGRAATFEPETIEKAKSILSDLTFIGEKEYREATAGIALYWKAVLDSNPNLQLLALGGEITKKSTEKMVKSDEYLLDTILTHFTDEELGMYAGRLITDFSELTAKEAQNVRIVFLDDWTISGSQLTTAVEGFCDSHPRFSSSVEIQLVAANNERITRGFKKIFYHSSEDGKELSIPVRSYFKAHYASKATETRAAHITGWHSSVDYDFELVLAEIAAQAKGSFTLSSEQAAILKTLPPMTNIVRPYRLEGVQLEQKARLRDRSRGDKREAYGEV